MASAQVMFLDGPLAGRTRDVWATPDGLPGPAFVVPECPSIDWIVVHGDVAPSIRTHTYRIKPNRLSYGPKWVGAIHSKVGEQITTIVPYVPITREGVGEPEFDEYIERNAIEAMQRHAATEGLVAVEVHEVWRGTRADAREQTRWESLPGPASALKAADEYPWVDHTVFVVHEGVGMPAPAETASAVAP